tara:strand:- start:256 stop:654 length:399 start_codon:yes stop_codon:yes gene_type:complete
MSVDSLNAVTISQLKADAANDPSENLEEVSRRFEGLFLDILIKAMRKSVIKSDLLGSEAQNTYQQMFDHEISRELSGSGGIGLAEVIRDQLSVNNAARRGLSSYELSGAELRVRESGNYPKSESFSLGTQDG